MNQKHNYTLEQLDTMIGDLYEARMEDANIAWCGLSIEQKFAWAAYYVIESEPSAASQMEKRTYAVRAARESLEGYETVWSDALIKVADYILTGQVTDAS